MTHSDSGMAVAPALFREGMSRVAGAVHVVATDGPAGRSGFTATAVTGVTDDPATLLVCANAAGAASHAVIENRRFSINTLAADDRDLAEAFAGRTGLSGAERFRVGRWTAGASGVPRLETALVAFECRLVEARPVGTHLVIIGEAVGAAIGQSRPGLVYVHRAFHSL